MMVLALILAWLTFRGVIQPWQILALAGGMGVANALCVAAMCWHDPQYVRRCRNWLQRLLARMRRSSM